MKQRIAITALSSLSALGQSSDDTWLAYLSPQTCISPQHIGDQSYFQACIPAEDLANIAQLRATHTQYQLLDETVLYAILVSRAAMAQAGWQGDDQFGINIGSSRGATHLFEQYHQTFLTTGKLPLATSPSTTLGNIATWVAHDLHSQGLAISHSITCATGLYALLNGVAWLQSGMENKFLVGASEAPLTAFTFKQMQALKIIAQTSSPLNTEYPCLSLDPHKLKNTMVLGEAACVACLELGEKSNALAYIEGVGYAIDQAEHTLAISRDGSGLQASMRMALGNYDPQEIDAIITHTPGTILGDRYEMNAIKAVFGSHLPMLTNNKWKLGHTLATSGMLNIEMAILMMQHQQFIPVPYLEPTYQRKNIRKVLVNAIGFGGNAASVLISNK